MNLSGLLYRHGRVSSIIIIIIIMFVCLTTTQRAIRNQHPPRRAELGYIQKGQALPNCCQTRRTAIDNRTGSTSCSLTRWRDEHTSDKVAHYSIYQPRKDERVSWPSWLTYSGRLPHITRELQVERGTGKVRRSKTGVLPLCHATSVDGFLECEN